MKKFFIFCISVICLIIFFVMTYSKSTDDVVLKFSTWGSASEISILAPIIKDFENSHKGNRQ